MRAFPGDDPDTPLVVCLLKELSPFFFLFFWLVFVMQRHPFFSKFGEFFFFSTMAARLFRERGILPPFLWCSFYFTVVKLASLLSPFFSIFYQHASLLTGLFLAPGESF